MLSFRNHFPFATCLRFSFLLSNNQLVISGSPKFTFKYITVIFLHETRIPIFSTKPLVYDALPQIKHKNSTLYIKFQLKIEHLLTFIFAAPGI